MARWSESTKKLDVQPLGDRVVVRPMEAAEEMRGARYLPATRHDERPQASIATYAHARYAAG